MNTLCGGLALVVPQTCLALVAAGPDVSRAGEEKENMELESPRLGISLLALPVKSKTGELVKVSVCVFSDSVDWRCRSCPC